MKIFVLVFILACISFGVSQHTKDEWKSKTIYQVLIDRFARTDGSTQPCANLSHYCGGTFKGLQNNLDYIQNMGFDAIWISPVVENIANGYHGFWAKNIYKINPNFGTADELKELAQKLHERGMWLMVDVVFNHMAMVFNHDFSVFTPFNYEDYFHPYCHMNISNQTSAENCWLGGYHEYDALSDLDQSQTYVSDALFEWIKDLQANYSIDGFRVDTVRHVPKWFWDQYQNDYDWYNVGEVADTNLDYLVGYADHMSGILNYYYWNLINITFKGASLKP